MKSSILKRSLSLLLCTVLLAGCGTASSGGQNKGDGAQAFNGQDAGTDMGAGSSNEIEEMMKNANAQGSVYEFTENSCTIVPIYVDGETAMSAAPEQWDAAEKIQVVYQEGMKVQLAVYSAATGETTLSQASVSDIKKQTAILVYGEKQDSGTVLASKIVIRRIEGAADGVKGVD